MLFKVARDWALGVKGFTSASRPADLAHECAELLRYLACKHPAHWGIALEREARESAMEYLRLCCYAPDSGHPFAGGLALPNANTPAQEQL